MDQRKQQATVHVAQRVFSSILTVLRIWWLFVVQFYVFYQDKSIAKPGDNFTKKNPLLHHAQPLVNSEFMAKPLVIWSLPETGFLKQTWHFSERPCLMMCFPSPKAIQPLPHGCTAWDAPLKTNVDACVKVIRKKINWFEGFHTHTKWIMWMHMQSGEAEKRNLHESIPCHHKSLVLDIGSWWQSCTGWILGEICTHKHGFQWCWNLLKPLDVNSRTAATYSFHLCTIHVTVFFFNRESSKNHLEVDTTQGFSLDVPLPR